MFKELISAVVKPQTYIVNRRPVAKCPDWNTELQFACREMTKTRNSEVKS